MFKADEVFYDLDARNEIILGSDDEEVKEGA
jgi:hypothetical protein